MTYNSLCRARPQVDFNWLVEERSRVQRLAAELLSLIHSKKEDILNDEKGLDAILLLIGATFSLWRAIFLAYISITRSKNLDKEEEFLERFVRHNIIGYFDDHRMQEWSFGYYVNNCRFRLKSMCLYVEEIKADFANLEWLDEPVAADADSQVEWTRHCDALERGLNILSKRYSVMSSEPTV